MDHKIFTSTLLLALAVAPLSIEAAIRKDFQLAGMTVLTPEESSEEERWSDISFVEKVQIVKQEIEFQQELVKNNGTLKSYQLQQIRLGELEEKLARVYMDENELTHGVEAYQRALTHYLDGKRVIAGDEKTWFLRELSVRIRMQGALKLQGRFAEALQESEKILAMYLRYEKAFSGDQKSDFLAGFYFSTAELHVLNNEPEAAAKFFNLAAEEYHDYLSHQKGVSGQNDEVGSNVFRLLEIRRELAAIEALTDTESAIQAYQQVRDDLRFYLLKLPGALTEVVYLAEKVYMPLALLLEAYGDLPAAVIARQEAHELFAQLLRSSPEYSGYQNNLAANQVKLSEYYKQLNQPGLAINSLKLAQEQYDALLKSDPDKYLWKHYQGIVLGATGERYFEQGQYDLAINYQQQAILLLEPLVQADPSSVEWIGSLLSSFGKVKAPNFSWQLEHKLVS